MQKEQRLNLEDLIKGVAKEFCVIWSEDDTHIRTVTD